MNRRKFVVLSTVLMLAIILSVAGLAFYSNFAAKASTQLPGAINYLPADTQAVFGINVKKFVASPVYAQIAQQHQQEIGKDLSEIIAATGVDPLNDIDYVIGVSRASQPKGTGVVIATGRFKQDAITNFINTISKVSPITLNYDGATVVMIPESNGAALEKGVAFLSGGEIALGDLNSLKAVLDVRQGGAGINSNSTLSALLNKLDSTEMFWFAGDATVLPKMPASAPNIPAISAIQSVFGTFNLTTTINGKITVAAKDETSAGQLADFAKGLLALGQLASGQNADLAALIGGVNITQSGTQFDISVTIPLDLLQKMETAKAQIKK
jgi:hypothetical protein